MIGSSDNKNDKEQRERPNITPQQYRSYMLWVKPK